MGDADATPELPLYAPPARALGRSGHAKIVFNAHYLMYIDTAMSEYWRALALPYEASMHILGGEMYVKKRPRWNTTPRPSWTTRWTWACAARGGNSSCLFEAAIFCGDRLCWSLANWSMCLPTQPADIPRACPLLRAMLEGTKAGAEMVEVRTGDWNTLGRDAARLRTRCLCANRASRRCGSRRTDANAPRRCSTNWTGQPVPLGGRCSSTRRGPHQAHGGGLVRARCPVGRMCCWLRW